MLWFDLELCGSLTTNEEAYSFVVTRREECSGKSLGPWVWTLGPRQGSARSLAGRTAVSPAVPPFAHQSNGCVQRHDASVSCP
jgi:hypothetical protein